MAARSNGSARLATVLCLVLLVRCGSDPEPAVVEPVPADETVDETPTPEEPEATDPAPPEEETAPTPRRALELPEELPEIEQLPSREVRRGGETVVEIVHPNPRVQEILAAISSSLREDLLGIDDEESSGGCTVALAHEHLVSYECTTEFYYRGGSTMEVSAVHYVIAGDTVRPVDAADAFTDPDALRARVQQRCEEVRDEPLEEDPESFEADMRDCSSSTLVLGEQLRALFDDEWCDARIVTLEWDEVRELIAEDGPLAPVFTDAAPRALEAVSPEAANAWTVSATDLSYRLVARWATLEPQLGAQVGMRAWDGGFAQLLYLGTDDARARALARRLGGDATPVLRDPQSRAMQPDWQKTRNDVNLRV